MASFTFSNPFSTPNSGPSESVTPGSSSATSDTSTLTTAATSSTTPPTSTSSTPDTSSNTSATSEASSSIPTDSSSSASSTSSTSSSSTSSSSFSSVSDTSTSSSTLPTVTGPTSAAPTQTSTNQFSTEISTSTGSDGVVVEVTQTVVAGSGATNTLAAQDKSSSTGFFHNKGAVAGVFTVVGLIALAIGIALVTNAVRRRRAKKFDREIDAAAEEARKAAANPDFFDADYNAGYEDFGGGLGRSRSVYTDGTHGTYSQQPLRPVESYGMSELHAGDPYSAAGVGVGAAGVEAAAMAGTAGNAGVGAAGLNRSRSTTAPYNAFAGPGAYPRPAAHAAAEDPFYDSPPMPAGYAGAFSPSQNNQASLFDATGLAGAGATAATTAVNLARGPSTHQRSTSRGGTGPLDRAADPYAPDPYAQTQYYPPQPPRAQSHSPPHAPYHADADPYGGYEAHSPTGDNFAVSSSPEHEHESDEEEPPYRHYDDEHDVRDSMGDEEDYGYGGGRRVLKVANE